MAIYKLLDNAGADKTGDGVSPNAQKLTVAISGTLSGATVKLEMKAGSADWKDIHYEDGTPFEADEGINDVFIRFLPLEASMRARTEGGDISTSVTVELIG